MPCRKAPQELRLKSMRSMQSCWPGAALFLPSDGGSRAAAGALGAGGSRWQLLSVPIAEYQSTRANSFLLASLSPLGVGVGHSGNVEDWCWLSASPHPPNPHHELKTWSTCDMLMGSELRPAGQLDRAQLSDWKEGAGARDRGNVLRWRLTSFKMQMWVRNWKDTVTRHVRSCRDALESQTKLVLRQQLYSAEASENPSQDWEKGFCVTSKLNWWCHLHAKGWELNRVPCGYVSAGRPLDLQPFSRSRVSIKTDFAQAQDTCSIV